MAGLVPAIHVFRHRLSSRHCKRSEAIQNATKQGLDCFVATLLAMTKKNGVAKRLTNLDVVPAQAGTHTPCRLWYGWR